MVDLNKLAAELHAAAVEKGFWAVENAHIKHIAKMHSELSEAVQADRAGIMYTPEDSISGKPEGVAVELADFVMMTLDFCAEMDVDINLFMGIVNLEAFKARSGADFARLILPELVVMLHRQIDRMTSPESDSLSDFSAAMFFILWGVPFWMEQRGFNIWEIIEEKRKANLIREKLHGRLY